MKAYFLVIVNNDGKPPAGSQHKCSPLIGSKLVGLF